MSLSTVPEGTYTVRSFRVLGEAPREEEGLRSRREGPFMFLEGVWGNNTRGLKTRFGKGESDHRKPMLGGTLAFCRSPVFPAWIVVTVRGE